MLKAGDMFPEFNLLDQDGARVTNQDLNGRRAVIYFYPKDDTPGCTVEACGFRDLAPSASEVRVYGVSPDDPASHRKFIDKFGLNFPLLSDVGHSLAEACGVWVEKSTYGKKYMGVARTTFLLDEEGRVARVWQAVKPEGHAEQVLAALPQR